MGFSVADRVKERTTTTGVGSVTLNGDYVDGFQPFSSGISDGETTFYVIDEPVVNNSDIWEVGVGTFVSGYLTRDIILSSSSSGQKIDLSGSGVVSITYPAERSVYLDDSLHTMAGSGLFFINDSGKILNTQNGGLYWNNVKLTDNHELVYVSGASVYASGVAAALGVATSSNTPDTIVKRDGSGGFCAGTIQSTKLDVDNITIDGNTICSTDTNGNINIKPNGAGSIVGGCNNTVTGTRSIVAGGSSNTITNANSAIVAGYSNCITSSYAIIGAGSSNSIISSSANHDSIVAGSCNKIQPIYLGANFIAGGCCNTTCSAYTSIGGGKLNCIDNNSYYATIPGGISNTICNGACSAVAGNSNTINAASATIAGGSCNTVLGNSSSILGGSTNYICGVCSSIGGGYGNIVCGNCSSAVGASNTVACSNSHAIGSGIVANLDNTTFVNNLYVGDLTTTPNIPTGINNTVVIVDDDYILKTDEIDERVWGTTLVDETDLAYVSGVADYASGVAASIDYSSYQNISSDINITINDDLIFVDSTVSEINVYMPLASGIGGKQIKVKWIDGTNPITIIASGVETIDGQNSFSMYQKYQSITFSSNNTNWFIT